MKVSKDEVVEALRGRGEDDLADHAALELPEEVDTDHHAAKLELLGINVPDLLGGVGGTFG